MIGFQRSASGLAHLLDDLAMFTRAEELEFSTLRPLARRARREAYHTCADVFVAGGYVDSSHRRPSFLWMRMRGSARCSAARKAMWMVFHLFRSLKDGQRRERREIFAVKGAFLWRDVGSHFGMPQAD
jgi:hypothetical protein